MKKISQFLMLLVTGSTLSYGAAVPVKTAKSVGYNFLAQRGGDIKNADDLQLIYTSGNGPEYFYVFGAGHSFVMVSADDAVTPVLGYSMTSGFRPDHMPISVSEFLENYNSQIEYAKQNNLTATEETAAEWTNLIHNTRVSAAKTTAAVAPLMTTTWDQGTYYNTLCPADAAATTSGGHAVTGCVATALAQVLRFWRWPNVGVGSHTYWSAYGELTADFSATTYHWNLMPDDVSSTNKWVATLMSHCGISVDMDYSANESGAFVTEIASPITNCSEYALKTYFDYKPTLIGKKRSGNPDLTWIAWLKADIDAGRPVIVDGNGSAGGHNFVFNGYDASNKFYVNWGWGGASDGYYTISALNPPALGIGGGGGGFNTSQHAIFGVEPNGTPTPMPSPDIYEVNNTAATAYKLPITWVSNNATVVTTGSNFHVPTDIDYYKIILPHGYIYTITARVNDAISNNDPTTIYTGDAQWAYSLNGGSTWSPVTYDSTMPGSTNITVNNLSGSNNDSVVFRVVQHISKTTGTYLLNLSKIHRSNVTGVNDIEFASAKVFPNPATEQVTVDFSETGTTATSVSLTDITGREVYTSNVNNEKTVTVPVRALAAGVYILNVSTDAGMMTRKITVGDK